MLRNQAKKQGGFYVCASCRHGHHHRQGLAHLPSGASKLRGALSTIMRPSSSIPLFISGLHSPSRAQSNTAHADESLAQPATTRIGRRGYASWGKFGSNMLPGQTNAAWGAAQKNNQRPTQPLPTWHGGAPSTNIPPAPGTSAFAGKTGSGISPARPTSPVPGGSYGGGLSTAQPTTNLGRADPSRQLTRAPTQPSPYTSAGQKLGHGQSITSPLSPAPSQGLAPGRVPLPGLQKRDEQGLGGSSGISQAPPNRSPSNAPRPEIRSSRMPNNAQSNGTNMSRPDPPSYTATRSTIASGPASSPTTSSTIGQPRAPPARPAPSTSFGSFPEITKSGAFTRSASGPLPTPWASGRPNPLGSAPGTIPGQPTFQTSGAPPVKSTSGLNAMSLKPQNSQPDSITSQKETAPTANIQSGASGASFKSTSNQGLDNSFKKAPSRPAPQGAEFPQLRRRSSRDDLFESMSPFNLPSRKSTPPDLAAPPFAGRSPDLTDQPSPRRVVNRRDEYPRWGPLSEIGSIAPPDSPRREAQQPHRPRSSNQHDVPVPVHRKVEGSMSAEEFSKEFDIDASNATQSKGLESRGVGEVGQSDWETDQDHAPGSQETRPQEPRENDRKARSSEDRRVRGWDLGEDMDDDPGYDRRGKGGKPKNSKSRRQGMYDDEEVGDYDFEEEMAIQEQRKRHKEKKRAAKEPSAPKTIRLPEYITVYDLAEALRVKPAQFLQDLEQLGFENILHDSVMTGETAALVAAEYGLDPVVDTGSDIDLRPRPPPEDPSNIPPRPPIVTIMGHVDHGKTTMLDFLRKSSVAAQEAGGITQHIGAFSVKLSAGKIITFLDTPGHAAFLTMRQRGANVTDMVVLVVAVDDSVKPQTLEAIKHAKTAQVPIIVAINKIDLDPNRIEHVKQDLAGHDLEIEDFGGDVQVVALSAKTGKGMRDLEEAILTLSEILDVRAELDGMAEGWVLEASVKPDGKVATVLVKRGTLRVGDLIVAGTTYTRIRVMKNEAGVAVQEAAPGTPVEIYGGWKEAPMAGDMVLQAPDETKAQAAVEYRKQLAERALAASQKAHEELANREKAEQKALEKMMAEEAGEADAEVEPVDLGPKMVNIIVRGDVMGSVEAVCGSIQEIGNNEVQARILRSSPGQITEGDVELLATAKGCIVNFNNPIPAFLLRRAENAGVKILDHRIIYEVVEDVKREMSQQLKPIYSQRVHAEAEVLQVFPINIVKRKYKNIAGVKVKSGTVTRGGLYRVVRQGEKIHEGKLDALKQLQKNVTEIRNGNECGMMFEEFDDFQVGDVIQLYENVEEKRYL